jgi:branched-chain amino acid transport system substrate-binding protein
VVLKLPLAALLAVFGACASGAALADSAPLKVGTALDFTTPYAYFIPEYSAGQRDYIALLNARGGIKGHKVEIIVLDHANDLERGLADYRQMRDGGALVMDFLNETISQAVTPRALADGANIMTMFHGRADAADGRVFPTIFPMSATFWSQAADLVKYIEDVENEEIDGKRIALIGMDNDLGHDVEPVLAELAKRLRFKFRAFYYPLPGMDQTATWKEARRFDPDWTLVWGAGLAQGQSVRAAIAARFKLDHVAFNVAMAESDLQQIGPQAAGVLKFEGVASGRELPLIAAIEQEVIAKGQGAGKPEDVGNAYYNGGVAGMALFAEAARLALESEGEPLTPAKLKHGYEQLRDFTAEDLLPPTTITARDHQGGGRGRVVQWDGKRWVERRHWFAAYQDIVWDLITRSSARFKATKN